MEYQKVFIRLLISLYKTRVKVHYDWLEVLDAHF